MKLPVFLRIYKEQQLVGVKQLSDQQIVVGRQAGLQVTLDDDSVSVIHAAIEERDSGFYVCDLGSEKGTILNGQAILDEKINPGDVITIGVYRIEFQSGIPKFKAPGEITGVGIPIPPPESSAGVAAGSVASSGSTGSTSAGSAEDSHLDLDYTVVRPSVPNEFEQKSTPQASESESAASSDRGAESKAAAPVDSQAPAKDAGAQNVTVTDIAGTDASNKTQFNIQVPERFEREAGASMMHASPASDVGVRPSVGKLSLKKTIPSAKSSQDKHKARKTFAPPSRYNDVQDFVRPTKGTVVEILVAWRERIISTYHYTQKQTVMMGSSPKADIVLPVVISKQQSVPIVRIDSRAVIFLYPEMNGELVRNDQKQSFAQLAKSNRILREKNFNALVLDQGELAKVELGEGVAIYVRYVGDTPKPIMAPPMDFTPTEIGAVVMGVFLTAALWLYMSFQNPPPDLPGNDINTEPSYHALVISKPPPTPAPLPVVTATPEPKPTPPPTPAPVVKATPSPKKVEDPKAITQVKRQEQKTKETPGAASNPAKSDKKGPSKMTSVKQGGAIKTTDKEGAQMQTVKKNIEKSGLFGTFGKNGANDRIDTSSSGAGTLAGAANQASGKSGNAENRPGTGLGSQIKKTAVGGTGTAIQGIPGVKTNGRGSGNSGYGTGGLGSHAGVKLVVGGNEATFSGSIDREAIRRVVLSNQNAIQKCYERSLDKKRDISGRVVIEFTIGEQGRVLSAKVANNELGDDGSVGSCIVLRLREWKFPEPPTDQEVTVKYPFIFSTPN